MSWPCVLKTCCFHLVCSYTDKGLNYCQVLQQHTPKSTYQPTRTPILKLHISNLMCLPLWYLSRSILLLSMSFHASTDNLGNARSCKHHYLHLSLLLLLLLLLFSQKKHSNQERQVPCKRYVFNHFCTKVLKYAIKKKKKKLLTTKS